MKRFSIFCALVAFMLVVVVGSWTLQSEATTDSPVQFEGVVSSGGGPAQLGTVVYVYLGSTLKGQTTIQVTNGFYQITGTHPNFPSGNYRLFADDQVSLRGEKFCYKSQGVENQTCNIVLDINY